MQDTMVRLLFSLYWLSIILLISSCQTFVSADGSKHRQLFPAKDRMTITDADTNKYALRPFHVADYSGKRSHRTGKRLVEIIDAPAIHELSKSKEHYLVYFWNPTCPGTAKEIRTLDSLSKNGAHIIVASLRNAFDAMESRLSKTSFSQYPLFVIESREYPKGLLRRKIGFIKDCCEGCYIQFRDDLAVADYLSIERHAIQPILFTTPTNVLSH